MATDLSATIRNHQRCMKLIKYATETKDRAETDLIAHMATKGVDTLICGEFELRISEEAHREIDIDRLRKEFRPIYNKLVGEITGRRLTVRKRGG